MNKKIFITLIIFSLICAPVLASGLLLIAEKKGIKFYIDTSSIHVNNDFIDYYFQINSPKHFFSVWCNKKNLVDYWVYFKSPDGADNKMHMISDCFDNNNGILMTIKTYPNSSVISDDKHKNLILSPVDLNSLAGNAHGYACKVISNDIIASWNGNMNNYQKGLGYNDNIYCKAYAEMFLNQALRESYLLMSKNMGKQYVVDTSLALAGFFEKDNRVQDALQVYKDLQSVIQKDEKYVILNNNVSRKIDELTNILSHTEKQQN
jgi:hypothetical protein